MDDYDSYKPAFDKDGFVVIRQPLGDEFGELVRNIKRFIDEVAPQFEEGSEFAMYGSSTREPETMIRLNQMHKQDSFFAEYSHHPRWVTLAETILGEPVKTANVVWFNKPPRTIHPSHPTPPHQDNYYYKLDPAQMMSVWMALEPVGPENGCLRYVAGSHKKGVRPHEASSVYGFSQGISAYGVDDWAQEVCVSLEPGDMIVHHCMTIHRADANESDHRHRPGFSMLFRGESAKVDQAEMDRHLENVRSQQAKLGRKVTI